MRWYPEKGHVPRGFCGALGKLKDVKLVLIVAEPGKPHTGESYLLSANSDELIAATTNYSFQCYERGKDQIHRNMRYILDLFFPNMRFEQQMVHTWITESVLCSAKQEGESVPSASWRQCVKKYLSLQIEIIDPLMVLALGAKARDRTRGIDNITTVGAAAPPGCNFKGVKESWLEAAHEFRKRVGLGLATKTNSKDQRQIRMIKKIPEKGKPFKLKKEFPRTRFIEKNVTKSNKEKLLEFSKTLSFRERDIVEKLGGMFLDLGHIQINEGNKTYDLAFKSLNKSRKPSFATFITYTHKQHGGWNRNEIPDSIVVQFKSKTIRDPDKIENPSGWNILGRELDHKKGWFSFRIYDSKPETLRYAFWLVKEAYDSF